MAAVQQFLDGVGARDTELHHRRTQLLVVSPPLEGNEDLPEHLRQVIGGIVREIHDRVFRPIHAAPDLEAAQKRIDETLGIFAELWPAMLQAIGPWLEDHPKQLVEAHTTRTDLWTAEESRFLGDEARAWFAAAQDARFAIANALVHQGTIPKAEQEKALVWNCIVADFALQLGLFMVAKGHGPAVTELPSLIGLLAYTAAKKAYVLISTPRFADPARREP